MLIPIENKSRSLVLLPCRCIDDRLDAVTEIVGSDSVLLKKVRAVISNLPDLEKGLTSIIHGKVSCLLLTFTNR